MIRPGSLRSRVLVPAIAQVHGKPPATDCRIALNGGSAHHPHFALLGQDMDGFPWLLAAAAGSALVALLHIGCIAFGSPWYQRFGAGRRMVQLARAGHWWPPLVTACITVVLVAWTLYALAAGRHSPLPASRLILPGIAALLLLRAAMGFGLALFRPGYNGARFWVISSLTCLGLGLAFALGTHQAWNSLG